MKKWFLAMLAIVVLIMPTTMASAETNKETIITNNNGVRMTSEQYDMLLPRFNAEEIAEMDQETFERYKDIDYREWESTTTTIYVETDTTVINGIPIDQTEREITKEEWNNISENTAQTNLTRGVTHETNAKKLTLNFLKSGNRRIIDLYNKWKTNPTVRSFDIIAVRWANTDTFVVANATGEQRGNNRLQTYSFNGTNMKRESNGVGISMNLFDPYASIYPENHNEQCY